MLPSVSINLLLNSYTSHVICDLQQDGEFFGFNLGKKINSLPTVITLLMTL